MKKVSVPLQQDELEVWKPILGWIKYEVSNLGRVRRLAGFTSNGHRWRGKVLAEGICVVLNDGSRQKSEKISRLVLLAFVGPAPKGMEGCHADDNKLNNKLSNLRWDTHKANAQDALRNGLMAVTANAKLTNAQVRQIRREYRPGAFGTRFGEGPCPGSLRWLANKYGVSGTAIRGVIIGRSWKGV